jgi:hypothetical protein
MAAASGAARRGQPLTPGGEQRPLRRLHTGGAPARFVGAGALLAPQSTPLASTLASALQAAQGGSGCTTGILPPFERIRGWMVPANGSGRPGMSCPPIRFVLTSSASTVSSRRLLVDRHPTRGSSALDRQLAAVWAVCTLRSAGRFCAGCVRPSDVRLSRRRLRRDDPSRSRARQVPRVLCPRPS